MAWFGKFQCALCGQQRPMAERARRSERPPLHFCAGCVERWTRAGRKCVRCGAAVTGAQELGFFPEQKTFGHYDCGGLRLL